MIRGRCGGVCTVTTRSLATARSAALPGAAPGHADAMPRFSRESGGFCVRTVGKLTPRSPAISSALRPATSASATPASAIVRAKSCCRARSASTGLSAGSVMSTSASAGARTVTGWSRVGSGATSTARGGWVRRVTRSMPPAPPCVTAYTRPRKACASSGCSAPRP